MPLKEPSHDFSSSTPGHHDLKRPISERKLQANRRNALRSTGPTTERGKRTISHNAIKHGFLAREVVITAGEGEESLKEFHALVESLGNSYLPVGVVEEALVQTIATTLWRKARVIRAENGEIRKRLDTISVDRRLRDSDKANLLVAVSNLELGLFSRENAADKIPLMEQWTAIQRVQTNLRAHHSGLAYLRALLENAKAELTRDSVLSDQTCAAISTGFIFWDYLFALKCLCVGPSATKAENQASEVADGEKEENQKKCAAVVASIDHELERLRAFEDYTLEREGLAVDAEARSFSLPNADATDKLLRYESHLDRQLYRAMDQLERLQRQRRGESVPPPLNVNLGKRS